MISTHSSSVHARICVAIFLVRLPGRTSFLSLFCAASAAYTLRVCVVVVVLLQLELSVDVYKVPFHYCIAMYNNCLYGHKLNEPTSETIQ